MVYNKETYVNLSLSTLEPDISCKILFDLVIEKNSFGSLCPLRTIFRVNVGEKNMFMTKFSRLWFL